MEDIIFNISCTLDLSQETVQYELRHVKRNSAFEHAQVTQIQIIQRMRKISTGPLLFSHIILLYPMILVSDSESTIRLHE